MGKQTLAEIIRTNVEKLRRHAGAGKKMGQRAFAELVGIGEGTIWRIDKLEGGTNVETLETIAGKFGLQGWQLLIEGFDVKNPPMLVPVTPSERLLWEAVEAARKGAKEPIGAETGRFTARTPKADSGNKR